MFESLSERLGGVFDRLTKQGALSEADVVTALREVRTALLEAHEEKPLAALLLPELRRIALELDRLGAVTEAMRRAKGVFRAFIRGIKFRVEGLEVGIDVPPETGTADSGDSSVSSSGGLAGLAAFAAPVLPPLALVVAARALAKSARSCASDSSSRDWRSSRSSDP